MTARETYNERLMEAVKKLNTIRSALDAHQTRYADHPRDRGYAGDLDAVNEALDRVILLLGDQSCG